MKRIALPLTLLASIATLTSCTNKTQSITETPAPQAVVETAPIAPAPDAMTPPVVPPAPTPEVPTEMTPVETASGVTVAPSTPVTRTETVNYTTPAGSDPVEFSMTVTDGVITAASATPKATHEISNKRQTAFAGEIASKVVGKKISELSLSAVG